MAVISPDTFDPLLRYVSVRLQQGVPIVDADVNELDDIRSFELRAFLKWFVGDGVPDDSDGFRIAAAALADDVVVTAGVPAAPPGVGNVQTGLRFSGRCLVDGLDALIGADLNLRAQPLHVSQPGSAALGAAWGVPTVPELPAIDGTALLYLDVWDRLVTPAEAPVLIFPGLGTESAARLRREWVVRWTANAAEPVFGDADFIAGHGYYPLATVVRRAADPVVVDADVTDLRERRLLVPPATLVEDLLDTTPARYRRGLDRPAISVREAVNALLRGELPSTPDAPIAPALGNDDMSYAFEFAGPDVVGFWHSDRVAATNQVFAVRWPQGTPAAAALAPPQQITQGVVHRLPHALQVPGGDFLVVYETNTRDIHYRRAPHLAALAGGAETAVADAPAVFDRHPFVVRAGDQLVFFWHRNAPAARLVYRRRQYGAPWTEAGAAWLDGAGVELSPIVPAAPSPARGEVHAVEAGGRVYVAFRTGANDIGVARLDPAAAAIEDWGGHTLVSPNLDQQPWLLVDGAASVWAFWRSGDQGIFHARFDVAANAWGPESLVPGTDFAGDADSRPTAVRDAAGALWLVWVSLRAGTNDLWLVRRNPDTGGWGTPRQVVAAAGNDDLPFARISADGVIWLFWRSSRTGSFDLYFKRLVTVI